MFHSGKLLVKKDEYLKRNGANVFKELVKSTHGKNNPFRIFSLKELQKATNNFSADTIFNDSFRRTYRGIIEDRHVAVRIPIHHTLLNEVVSLSLIKHRNVVKLLGCCFETENSIFETNLLIVVHELPPNGTLEQNIFYKKPPVELLWADRLRIATEIADALAYLHSELHMTHGLLWDPQSVLLDEFLSAKLSAFDFSQIQNQAESSDVETNNRNKFRKLVDAYDFGNILLNLLGIDDGEVCKCKEKVEILKYLKVNVSEKEMPQIEAYIDLLLRCQSSDKVDKRVEDGEVKVPSMEEIDLLLRCQSSDKVHKRVEDGEDKVPSMEEVVRELRRIRRLDSPSDYPWRVGGSSDQQLFKTFQWICSIFVCLLCILFYKKYHYAYFF